jgi:catechol 2,3-dioxygenase-like lactoylglutathione lyase family enzyme
VASFEVVGLDHVNVTTPEELEADVLSFYEDRLGLEPLPKPAGTRSRGGWFRAGAAEIHVSIDEHNPSKSSHFGLVVTDFEAVIRALREAGQHLEQARPIPGRERFFTRDPAGNLIELIAYAPADPNATVEYEESTAGMTAGKGVDA